ncbi:hypothetical protein [Embleya sp. NPDC001921]
MSTPKKSPAPRRVAPRDDKPFDFNLDAVEAEVELTPFRVNYHSQRWEFAHAQDLDVWNLMELADGGDLGAMVGIFKAALGDDRFAEFRKLGLKQYKLRPLFNAYQQHCGHGEGESEASADS